MEVIIDNKIRLKRAPPELNERIINELRFPNPKYNEAINSGRSVYNISPFIYNFDILPDDSLRVPRGCKNMVYGMIDEMGLKAKTVDNRTLFDPVIDINSSMIRYRPYQYNAIKKLATVSEGVLVAPAGSGKTVMGLSLIPLYGQPTLWLTHTGPLAKQVVDRVNFFLPTLSEDDIGFIGAGKWSIGKVFTVAMVQTLIRRLPELYKIRNSFGLAILDEAHHCPASTFLKVVGCFNPYYLYGLTATPYRRDGLDKLIFQTLGDEVANIPIELLEKENSIMIPQVRYRSFDHVRRVHDNVVSRILKDHIISNDRRNHLIVGDVLSEAGDGNICIVLSDRKAHCETLYELIKIGWEKTGIATGDYSKKYVAEQIAKLSSGEITVLVCTNQLLGEGFDFAPLNRAFIATPFRFEGKCEQVIGRIQRPSPGKKDAIVYDYVDANIGVLQNQFYNTRSSCRYKAYQRVGASVEPY